MKSVKNIMKVIVLVISVYLVLTCLIMIATHISRLSMPRARVLTCVCEPLSSEPFSSKPSASMVINKRRFKQKTPAFRCSGKRPLMAVLQDTSGRCADVVSRKTDVNGVSQSAKRSERKFVRVVCARSAHPP